MSKEQKQAVLDSEIVDDKSEEDRINIKKSFWCLAYQENALWDLLREIARRREWVKSMGDAAYQYPDILQEYSEYENQLQSVTIDSWETIINPDYEPKSTLPDSLLGYQIYPQTVIQAQYYSADAMRILSLEMRTNYLIREIEALETLASNEMDLEGLDLTLQEIIFRFRDVMIKDPEFDDSILLSHSKGGRNLMLLYLAVEHSFAQDYETTEDIINCMDDIPSIKQYLRAQLVKAKEYSPSQRRISDQASERHLQMFVGVNYEDWEQEANNTEFDVTIGVKPHVALKIFGEPIFGRLLTATEFSDSGGKSIKKTPNRSLDYNKGRNKIEVETLSYPGDNIFLPKIVYGALNTSNRLDKGNGYGEVVLHLKKKDDITYTIGDSMPSIKLYADSEERRVNEREAKIAAVYNEAHGQKNPDTGAMLYPNGVSYIEAQIPGVTFDDIKYVSLSHFDYNLSEPDNAEEMRLVANAVMDHGVSISLDFFNNPQLMYQYIDTSDHSRTISDQIRNFIDPTGERWGMISIRLIEPEPSRKGETLEDCIKRYRDEHGIIIISEGVETIPGGEDNNKIAA